MELAEPAAEARIANEAAPPLAHQGGAEVARRVVGWDAKEHLFQVLFKHLRRHGWR
jgi:hypothetical protein